jgi:hypothetical protein
MQLPLAALSRFCIRKRNVLIARVVIYAYNHHVRLLSPELLVVNGQSTQVWGADVGMQSCVFIVSWLSLTFGSVAP